MPWKETTAMSEKKRLIQELNTSGKKVTDICQEFGISRTTVYYWKKRFEQQGYAGLSERSRKPHHAPNKTKKEIELLCISIRSIHPRWAGDKIRRHLLNEGCTAVPSEKTIDRILKRYGLITEEETQKHTAWKRFEHEFPNDLWQMDFKGNVRIGDQICYPLTILDDHSRFCLCVKACLDQGTDTVKKALIEVFTKYGLPKRMTMDNGPPWGYSARQQHTKLCAWLIRQGIYVSHSRPAHPQTQGKLERMHRTLKEELLSLYYFKDIHELQEGFDEWRRVYNEIRPHAAINLDTPSQRYKRSNQAYCKTEPKISYDESFVVRMVQRDGEISFNGKLYLISSAFHGYPVGLRPTEPEGLMEVHFCHQKVALIDLKHPIS
jgi:transposase InsO family protein